MHKAHLDVSSEGLQKAGSAQDISGVHHRDDGDEDVSGEDDKEQFFLVRGEVDFP